MELKVIYFWSCHSDGGVAIAVTTLLIDRTKTPSMGLPQEGERIEIETPFTHEDVMVTKIGTAENYLRFRNLYK